MKSALITISFLLISCLHAGAQVMEIEPNAPCELAQGIGGISLPFVLSGALDALSPDGDVDFFRVTTTPTSGVEVRLEGLASGSGTLRDPFLGVFDSNCSLIALNDDAFSLDSRVFAIVPGDGVLVLAATVCCDNTFQGEVGSGGSYSLSVHSAPLVSSIHGRVVDASTLAPIPGDTFPYAQAQLYRCGPVDCNDYLGHAYLGSDGEFAFTFDSVYGPLLAGTYQILVEASLYEDAVTEPFDAGAGEDVSVGDVALALLPRIGSVSGRIVDAITGIPLTGDDTPYTRVWLRNCDMYGCGGYTASVSTDAEGRFRFEGLDGYSAIPPGTYLVEAEAEEYHPAASDPFLVEVDEDVVIDNIQLEPYPIGFNEIRPCADLPAEGGTCAFSLRVVNRLDSPVEVRAWSIIQSYGTGSLQDNTMFQAGYQHRLSLGPAETKRVRFRFAVPESLRDGASICGDVFVGLGGASSRFDTVGQRRLFCIRKGVTGAFRVLSKKETREIGVERN